MEPMRAVMVGVIVAASAAALTVVCAFTRHARRYLDDLRHATPSFGERLAAGVWTTSAGTFIAGSAVALRFLTGVLYMPLWIAGWAMMGIGYFFQFGAWHAAAVGKFGWFRICWGTVLLSIGICVALFCAVISDP